MPATADLQGPLEATATVPRMRPRVSILVVNGFDRRDTWGAFAKDEAIGYPWIGLCLDQIERHSGGWDYRVLVYDNSHLPAHRTLIEGRPRVRLMPSRALSRLAHALDRPGGHRLVRAFEDTHPRSLDRLLRHVGPDTDYVVTLDSDSFPVRDDWLDVLVGECEAGAALAGVYRDEMAPTVPPFVHVSGLCVRRAELLSLGVSFNRSRGRDVGMNITTALSGRGRAIAPLRRSNARNFHFLIGGLYGDVIYHHGAGSRHAGFWTSRDRSRDELVRTRLRDAIFEDLDRTVAVLRGQADDDLGIAPA